jgi:hypothetical protein
MNNQIKNSGRDEFDGADWSEEELAEFDKENGDE